MTNDFLQLNEYKKMVDSFILSKANCICSPSNKLVEAVKYSLLSGGKRLRSVIFLVAFDFFNKEINPIQHLEVKKNLCFAIEALHTYTLIHDDLPCMDNDSTRRGKPSNHIVFGEAQALLAGDALLNLSFESACEVASFGKKYLQAVSYFYKNTGINGVIGGQSLELDLQTISDEQRLTIIENKTATLFKSSAVMGGICALGADKSNPQITLLQEFGKNFGIAFQIRDDLDDNASNFDLKKSKNMLDEFVFKAKQTAKELGCGFFVDLCNHYFM